MRASSAVMLAVTAVCAIAPPAAAQGSLLPSTGWGLVPTYASWSFGTPLEQSAGNLKSVTQIAIPLSARVSFGRWNLEGSAAYASSKATIENGEATTDISLNGLTDVKVRLSGPLVSDRVMVTAGVNIPSGATGLDAAQTSVLQFIGAPALGLPVPALGLGAGGTLGLVAASQAGAWAIALGGSAEQRTEYTAVELALADGGSLTKVTPGLAWHVTFGADRAIGEHRFALVVVGDGFSEDRITIASDGEEGTETRYTLGPQITAIGRLDVGRAGWREGAATLSLRHRNAFSDGAGEKVEGSSANYFEATLLGIRGSATGRGLILGLDARYQSGMTFSDALVAAAASTAGVTMGVEFPGSSTTFRLAARAQYGQFDTGVTKSNGFGLSLTGVVAGRR
jgi:hypothetical protein